MKIKQILAALALMIPGLLAAVTADPRPRTAINPDGSTVTYRVHGNEHFHFLTDVECTRIMEKDSRGFIVDAIRNGVMLPMTKENVELLKAEHMLTATFPAQEDIISKRRMAGLNNDGRSEYPTVGKGVRSLVVLVEFQDVEFTVKDPKDYYTRQLNERGFSDYGASGSALDYYIAASNGLYEPQFDVYGPVKVSKNSDYFSGVDVKKMELFIREALTQLHDKGEIDFSNYDLDNDGIVDTVFFYYAGYGKADSDVESIWPHQFDFRYCGSNYGSTTLVLDGKRVGPYACANEIKGWNPELQKNPGQPGYEPWVNGIGTFVQNTAMCLDCPTYTMKTGITRSILREIGM